MLVLDDMQGRVNGIPLDDQITAPAMPDVFRDTSLGYMTDEHTRLFTLWQRLSEKADLAAVRLRYATNSEEKEKLKKELGEAGCLADLYETIFWAELKRCFQAWDRCLGLHGFEVVTLKESPGQSFIAEHSHASYLSDDEE